METKILLLTLILSLFRTDLIFSQISNYDCIKGIWNSRNYLPREDVIRIDYNIINDDKIMIISYSESEDFNYYFDIKRIGFQNKEQNEISVASEIELVPDGTYLTQLDLSDNFFNVLFHFRCDTERMIYGNAGMMEFTRVIELPYNIILIINTEQRNNDTDYFQVFLNKEVKSICVDHLDIYDTPSGQDTGDLERDELVEILETSENWVRIKSLKTDIEGWIYDSCFE